MITVQNIVRDIVVFILLIAVVQTIIQRNSTVYKRQLYNLYAVHEVDPAFVSQAKTCAKQLQTARSLLAPDELSLDSQLRSLEKEVDGILQAYEKNSPALALLGPIGTASIVLKEQKLEKQLLATMQKINQLFAQRTHATLNEKLASIEDIIERNKTYLSQFNNLNSATKIG